MTDEDANPGASADGQELPAAQGQHQDPADTGKTGSDAGSVNGDDRAEQTTTDAIAEEFPELGDEDDDRDGDEGTQDQDQAKTPDQARKTEDDEPPQGSDQAKQPDEDQGKDGEGDPPKPDDPPRRRIRNLEKQLKEREAEAKQLMGSFETLNTLFQKAGLDPAKAADELDTLAKAKDGDQAARAALASRFGIQAQAPAGPALTPAQTALLKDLDLLDEFTKAGATPAAGADPKATGQPPAKAGGEPPTPAGTQAAPGFEPAALAAAEEGMRVIAHGVRAGEPTKAAAILEDAAKRFQASVEKAAEEYGVRPAPAKWPGLFRKAVGEATAAALAAKRPAQGNPPKTLRASSQGTHAAPTDSLSEVFPGTF
jgi:hypothetical protein